MINTPTWRESVSHEGMQEQHSENPSTGKGSNTFIGFYGKSSHLPIFFSPQGIRKYSFLVSRFSSLCRRDVFLSRMCIETATLHSSSCQALGPLSSCFPLTLEQLDCCSVAWCHPYVILKHGKPILSKGSMRLIIKKYLAFL